MFRQPVGELKVDFALLTPIRPRDDGLEPETTTPTFIAGYEGETLAVDQDNGNLYSGTFELTVYWGSAANNISARIVNLKGVYGNSRDGFQHDSQDVGTIFLSQIPIDGDTTAEFGAAAAEVKSGYRARVVDKGDLIGTAGIGGEFVGNGHSEGPLGVLGTWFIAETAANGLDFQGSVGTDLKPRSRRCSRNGRCHLRTGLGNRARPHRCGGTPARLCFPVLPGRFCRL